jgi:hypothetical protein
LKRPWRARERLDRQLVLGHVGGARRGIRILERIGCLPRVERDSELGPEAALRDRHLLRVTQGECEASPGWGESPPVRRAAPLQPTTCDRSVTSAIRPGLSSAGHAAQRRTNVRLPEPRKIVRGARASSSTRTRSARASRTWSRGQLCPTCAAAVAESRAARGALGRRRRRGCQAILMLMFRTGGSVR